MGNKNSKGSCYIDPRTGVCSIKVNVVDTNVMMFDEPFTYSIPSGASLSSQCAPNHKTKDLPENMHSGVVAFTKLTSR